MSDDFMRLGKAIASVQDARVVGVPLPPIDLSPSSRRARVFFAGVGVGMVLGMAIVVAIGAYVLRIGDPPPAPEAPRPVVVAPPPTPPVVDQALPPVKDECSWTPPIPDDTKVYAAGAYAGRELDYQLKETDDQGGQIDVIVNETKPVFLILGAYDPTVWNISWTNGTHIVGVYVYGYERQFVAGLPDDVPVLVSGYENGGPCRHREYWVAPEYRADVAAEARRLIRRNVDMLYPVGERGRVVVGSPLPRSAVLNTDETKPPELHRDREKPRARELGLDDAVRAGVIRRATSEDAQAWARAQAAARGTELPPVAGQPNARLAAPRWRGAYVVLKEFVFPAGLHGAHSATFFVAKGAPRPTGDPGHSVVYDFNTMSCNGVLCGRLDDHE